MTVITWFVIEMWTGTVELDSPVMRNSKFSLSPRNLKQWSKIDWVSGLRLFKAICVKIYSFCIWTNTKKFDEKYGTGLWRLANFTDFLGEYLAILLFQKVTLLCDKRHTGNKEHDFLATFLGLRPDVVHADLHGDKRFSTPCIGNRW